jgi:hypothetical protein
VIQVDLGLGILCAGTGSHARQAKSDERRSTWTACKTNTNYSSRCTHTSVTICMPKLLLRLRIPRSVHETLHMAFKYCRYRCSSAPWEASISTHTHTHPGSHSTAVADGCRAMPKYHTAHGTQMSYCRCGFVPWWTEPRQDTHNETLHHMPPG